MDKVKKMTIQNYGKDRVVVLTNKKKRLTIKVSDVLHIREYENTKGNAFDGNDVNTTVIIKVGDETKSNNVDQTFDEVFNLVYGEVVQVPS